MREDTALAYWSIVMGQKATQDAMKAILYTPKFSVGGRYKLNTSDPPMLVFPEAAPHAQAEEEEEEEEAGPSSASQ